MKTRSITLFDDGNKRFSTTTLATASKAVVAALRMGDKSKNRAFRVHDLVATQNLLFKLAKEILPDAEWTVNYVSTADMGIKAEEAFKADPNGRMGAVLQKTWMVFGAESTSDFGVSDNEELGIPMMNETQVKEVLSRFA
jgi:hypothetical protein